MRGLAFAAAGLEAISSVLASAQMPSVPNPQRWYVDWVDAHCTLSTGEAPTVGLSVWMTPGDPRPDLYLLGKPKAMPVAKGEKVTVTLMPGGETFSAPALTVMGDEETKALEIVRLDERFPRAFANASEVRVTGLRKPISIAIAGSRQAMPALAECVDAKLPEWGIDPKAYDSLRMPPRGITETMWFSTEDYPADAQSRGEMGDVIARLNVDVSGKVTGCTVVVSSKSSSLDNATCSSALQRGAFIPAVGADGRPTAAARIVRVIWRLEG